MSSSSPHLPIPANVQHHFSQQECSGLSIQAYCKENSLSAYTFYTWRKRYGKTNRRRSAERSSFAELGFLRLNDSVCELRFPSGVSMTVHHGAQREDLAVVFALIEGQRGC